MKRSNIVAVAAVITLSSAAGVRAQDTGARTLYERVGGMPAIQAVVDDLVARILADHRVSQWFAHAASDPENARAYKAKLADFLCQATGGHCVYTGLDLMTAHKGRGVTPEAFDAVVEDLVATLDKFKVPEKEKSQLLSLLAPLKSAVVQQEHPAGSE
jgi:hemoglobin